MTRCGGGACSAHKCDGDCVLDASSLRAYNRATLHPSAHAQYPYTAAASRGARAPRDVFADDAWVPAALHNPFEFPSIQTEQTEVNQLLHGVSTHIRQAGRGLALQARAIFEADLRAGTAVMDMPAGYRAGVGELLRREHELRTRWYELDCLDAHSAAVTSRPRERNIDALYGLRQREYLGHHISSNEWARYEESIDEADRGRARAGDASRHGDSNAYDSDLTLLIPRIAGGGAVRAGAADTRAPGDAAAARAGAAGTRASDDAAAARAWDEYIIGPGEWNADPAYVATQAANVAAFLADAQDGDAAAAAYWDEQADAGAEQADAVYWAENRAAQVEQWGGEAGANRASMAADRATEDPDGGVSHSEFLRALREVESETGHQLTGTEDAVRRLEEGQARWDMHYGFGLDSQTQDNGSRLYEDEISAVDVAARRYHAPPDYAPTGEADMQDAFWKGVRAAKAHFAARR